MRRVDRLLLKIQQAERLDALKALIDSGEAKNISEAIDIYKNTKK